MFSLWRFDGLLFVSQSENSAVRVRLLWDTLTPDTDQWPPLYILWRIHSKRHTHIHISTNIHRYIHAHIYIHTHTHTHTHT